jgi:hypothetical protein
MRTCSLWPVALLLTGCDVVWRLDEIDDIDVPRNDASLGLDAPVGSFCLGDETLLRVCFPEPPKDTLAALDKINTSSDPRCQIVSQASGPQLCVLAYGSISINAQTSATGSRPLVLVATETITVGNVLDVSSTSVTPPRIGPGAQTTCTAASGSPGATTGGGGAGGTFGFAGGYGANSPDATGGLASPATAQMAVVGGCAGGTGGAPSGSTPAAGGAGGGAIHLIAGGQIEITALGRINASGASGEGGAVMSGGGGGGAGGWIGLDAPTITNMGAVFARGGGAGGGGGTAMTGGDGFSATGVASGATGGSAGNTARNNFGAPGCGGPSGTVGGYPATPILDGGGGGGGGGCGIIRLRAPLGNLKETSPAITTP